MKNLPIIKILKESYALLPAREKHLSLSLFLLTFFSTTITMFLASDKTTWSGALADGFFFSIPLMLILTAHELGHYINAYAYGVQTTPPFFIPMPLISPIGTMGAFIRMRSPVPDSRALFDISFWGPAMSFVLSLPFFIVGLMLSNITEISGEKNFLVFGDSLLTYYLQQLIFPSLLPQQEILIHPMGFAGWTGLLVTAINLLPVGQLDGGHIAYSLFGKRQKQLAYLMIAAIAILALYYSAWIMWIFIFFFMGVEHPPLQQNYNSNQLLDARRRRWGYIALLVFVITFIPAPISPPAENSNEQNFESPFEPEFLQEDERWNTLQLPPASTQEIFFCNHEKKILTRNETHLFYRYS